LTRSEETVSLSPDGEYREVTVKLWGRGVVQRGVVTGAAIAGLRRFIARRGQFILSRIDARNGALGLVPPELDGAIVSNDFPVFNINRTRLSPEYLGWMCRTASFVEECKRASEGTTNRVRLQESRFLARAIPLPALPEQQRIVARIEELANYTVAATTLRLQATQLTDKLWPSILRVVLEGKGSESAVSTSENANAMLARSANRHAMLKLTKHNNAHPHRPQIVNPLPSELPPTWAWTTLGSVLTHLVDCVNDTPAFEDHDTGFIGLKSTNVRPYYLDLSRRWYMRREDFEFWNRRESPQEGDILLTREAPVGYACLLPAGGHFCLTQRLMLLRPDSETILPELLLHYLNSPAFLSQVRDRCRGLTTPHIRVQDAPDFVLPLPPMKEQVRIVSELSRLRGDLTKLSRFQTDAAAELDALLPAILDRAFRGGL
jgi:type I restriction enzyme S subunit